MSQTSVDTTHLMATYKRPDVRFVSGSGCHLLDDQGRRYLDFLSGIAVVSLGHAHPAVSAAIGAQAGKLLHVSNLFHNELAEPVAARLDWMVGDGEPAGGKVFFANSGAEANECAIKLARRFGGRGRHVVVSAYGGFHGRTLATLHATGQPEKHEPFAPMPDGFRHAAYGDIGAFEAAASSDVAAVLVEAIQGEAGVIVPPAGFLRELRQLCDERAMLLILDEVQTGLARTGRWFGFQHEEIRPDVVTLAKALGNGMPAGACWARAEVAEVFGPGDHGSTFGGQPIALSAVRATLEEMVAIDAPARARHAGARLQGGLSHLKGVAATRGAGLLLAAVLEEGLDAPEIAHRALEAGLVINAPARSVLRFAPPLIVSDEEIDDALGRLESVLGGARSRRSAS